MVLKGNQRNVNLAVFDYVGGCIAAVQKCLVSDDKRLMLFAFENNVN